MTRPRPCLRRWPRGIAVPSWATSGPSGPRCCRLSPDTRPRPAAGGTTGDVKTEDDAYFRALDALCFLPFTWTSKRTVMSANSFSSATVPFRSSHNLAADIRGITELSSSYWTSGGAGRETQSTHQDRRAAEQTSAWTGHNRWNTAADCDRITCLLPPHDSGEEGDDEDLLGGELPLQGGAARDGWNSGDVDASRLEVHSKAPHN